MLYILYKGIYIDIFVPIYLLYIYDFFSTIVFPTILLDGLSFK